MTQWRLGTNDPKNIFLQPISTPTLSTIIIGYG